MAWMLRMLARGVMVLLAAMLLRACDTPIYSLDARLAAPAPVVACAGAARRA